MGSGKTTAGIQVAEALGRQFVDNDVALERRAGRTAAQISASDGVDALHRQEAAELLAALADPIGRVIAAAASTVLDDTVRKRLAAVGWVVWLTADQATLAARMPSSPDRPMLDADAARLVARQSVERDPLYRRSRPMGRLPRWRQPRSSTVSPSRCTPGTSLERSADRGRRSVGR